MLEEEIKRGIRKADMNEIILKMITNMKLVLPVAPKVNTGHR